MAKCTRKKYVGTIRVCLRPRGYPTAFLPTTALRAIDAITPTTLQYHVEPGRIIIEKTTQGGPHGT